MIVSPLPFGDVPDSDIDTKQQQGDVDMVGKRPPADRWEMKPECRRGRWRQWRGYSGYRVDMVIVPVT